MGIFIAFWTKIFFKKYGFNLFEIIILLCFTLGMSMLIYTFFAILEGATDKNVTVLSSIIGMLYCVWSIGQFFDPHKTVGYLKALSAYILGCITFTIAVFTIGSTIDLIFH
jgi:hypothetical protein